MTNVTNFQDIIGAPNGDKTSVLGKFLYVLIGLTQLDTRCSYSPCEAAEDLIAGFPPIKPKAEFVQVRLELPAVTVIRAEQERFQVADGFVQPMQIAGFMQNSLVLRSTIL